jgi:hypothetical protein
MMIMEQDPGRLLDRFDTYTAPRVRKWLWPGET